MARPETAELMRKIIASGRLKQAGKGNFRRLLRNLRRESEQKKEHRDG